MRSREVPAEADVVIIGMNAEKSKRWFLTSIRSGGGSLGCQTQYHLAKMGVTNTVLLEKEQLTAGDLEWSPIHQPEHLTPWSPLFTPWPWSW